ncbi:MAG TPA: protein phosphatase 2C domain-containing protein [Dermatophilaceae bacterium]|jgi:serine/threonine protein phosphatase PrpC|nr:protein phosphatase 2C domain-containing protein [Dermatophilaceae bacterium]
MALEVRVGVATDVGRVREHNEDAAFARGSIFVVADGMGGHAAGEVASAIAASTLGELAERADLTVADVVAQVDVANRRIFTTAVRNPQQWGMATTLTGVALVLDPDADPDADPEADPGSSWAVVNLGDSRVYRYAAGELAQVSVDHSEVQEMVDAGYLTDDEARVHPLRHTVTRSLGRDRLPVVDTWVLPVVAGERFVVCSDGLTNEVRDAEIAAVLAVGADVQATAQDLVDRAVAHGGRDNVTVIVVEAADGPA